MTQEYEPKPDRDDLLPPGGSEGLVQGGTHDGEAHTPDLDVDAIRERIKSLFLEANG